MTHTKRLRTFPLIILSNLEQSASDIAQEPMALLYNKLQLCILQCSSVLHCSKQKNTMFLSATEEMSSWKYFTKEVLAMIQFGS